MRMLLPDAGAGMCGVCGRAPCSSRHSGLPRDLEQRLDSAYARQAAREIEGIWLEVRALEAKLAIPTSTPAADVARPSAPGDVAAEVGTVPTLDAPLRVVDQPSRSPYRVAMPRLKRASIAFAALVTGARPRELWIERAGCLIGGVDERGLVVLDVTEDGESGRNGGRLNLRSAERRARELGCRVIGSWHCHDGVRATQLSVGDLASVMNMLPFYGLARATAILVTPDRESGWNVPVFTTYVARLDGGWNHDANRVVVERAVLDELGIPELDIGRDD